MKQETLLRKEDRMKLEKLPSIPREFWGREREFYPTAALLLVEVDDSGIDHDGLDAVRTGNVWSADEETRKSLEAKNELPHYANVNGIYYEEPHRWPTTIEKLIAKA
jgi:hypothetical protein